MQNDVKYFLFLFKKKLLKHSTNLMNFYLLVDGSSLPVCILLL